MSISEEMASRLIAIEKQLDSLKDVKALLTEQDVDDDIVSAVDDAIKNLRSTLNPRIIVGANTGTELNNIRDGFYNVGYRLSARTSLSELYIALEQGETLLAKLRTQIDVLTQTISSYTNEVPIEDREIVSEEDNVEEPVEEEVLNTPVIETPVVKGKG